MHARVSFVDQIMMSRESLIHGSEVSILRIEARLTEATLPTIDDVTLMLTLRKQLRRGFEMTWSCLKGRMGRQGVSVCWARLRQRIWAEAVLWWACAEELESRLG